jgi:hypothetical protein
MIESLRRPPGAMRWAPRQRFMISEAGRQACQTRQAAVDLARRTDEGRAGLETAERTWAEPLGIHPEDGVFLEEFSAQPRSVAQVAEGLADCGATRAEAQASVDRMVRAGLLEPVPSGEPAGVPVVQKPLP